MTRIFPEFFPRFFCKADQCRHTCCQKWEIDIDDETMQKYKNTPDPLGEELQEWITKGEEDLPCFCFNERGYCHFLTEKGLCRLILEKGPQYLCQICRDHPRFYKYSYDSDKEEEIILAGTGLACERTVEQLLEEPSELFFQSTDRTSPLDFLSLLSRLHLPLEKESCFFTPCFEKDYIQSLLKRLEQTNPIDREWIESLSLMEVHAEELSEKASALSQKLSPWFLTNLERYILFRQLDECEAYDPETAARYAREAVIFILLAYAETGDLIRSTTRWSEQIEYDTENVYILLDSFDE